MRGLRHDNFRRGGGGRPYRLEDIDHPLLVPLRLHLQSFDLHIRDHDDPREEIGLLQLHPQARHRHERRRAAGADELHVVEAHVPRHHRSRDTFRPALDADPDIEAEAAGIRTGGDGGRHIGQRLGQVEVLDPEPQRHGARRQPDLVRAELERRIADLGLYLQVTRPLSGLRREIARVDGQPLDAPRRGRRDGFVAKDDVAEDEAELLHRELPPRRLGLGIGGRDQVEKVGEVELARARADEVDRRRHERDFLEADIRREQGRPGPAGFHPLELHEGLARIALRQAEALDDQPAREEVEVDIPDADGAAGHGREPGHGLATDQLRKGPEKRAAQEQHDNGDGQPDRAAPAHQRPPTPAPGRTTA